MNVVLVYNLKSGSARSLTELYTLFKKYGITVSKAIPIKKSFEHHLKDPIKNSEMIAVIGGDGTISAVAGLVAKTNATLIPLPGGTLNHFTKDLGIEQNLEKAIEQLTTAKPRSVDIGRINDTYFINNSSIGLYPSSLHARKRLEDYFGKWPAAIIGGLRALVRYRTYEVSINNQLIKSPFIFAGNNDYKLESFGLQGRDRLDTGLLSIYIVKSQSRWSLLNIFAHAAIGRLNSLDDFISFKTESFTITSKQTRLSVSHDGEVSHITTPITYSIEKKQLKIL